MPADRRDASPSLNRLRWPLRIALMVLVPLILLLVLEGGLRLVGFGYDTRLYKPVPGSDRIGSNAEFGYRFFPRAIARTPLLSSFHPDKSQDTYRIFVLGASAAAGVPNSVTSFAQILDEMLESRYPGVRFEVINTCMPAINSHVVRPIAEEVAGYDPDLFLVYLGNNEAIGPFNAGTAEQRAGVTSAKVHQVVNFRRTKLGQLVQRLGEALAGGDKVPEEWGGMSMYMDNTFRPDDPALQLVAANFRENLTAIVQAGKDAGADVVLSTVAVNLADSAPFASLNRADADDRTLSEFLRLYRNAISLDGPDSLPEAAEAYRRVLAVDDTFAETHFRLGRVLLRLGRMDEALDHFVRALELDALPFRTTPRLNNVIRDVAQEQGAILVDAAGGMLGYAVQHGTLPGMNFFYEHVHLQFDGNYLLAALMFEQVAPLLPDDIQQRQSPDRPLPSVAECARHLALTGYDRYNMLTNMLMVVRGAPFTNQYNHQETLGFIQGRMQELKDASAQEDPRDILAIYQEAVRRRPDDLLLRFNYAKLLRNLRQTGPAEREMEHIRSLIPPGYEDREPAR